MNAPSYGKTRKDNATTRIMVGQKEGRKELGSQMKPPPDTTKGLKPAVAWIDCPKDRAEVNLMMNKGKVTARQLAEALRQAIHLAVDVVLDCGAAHCRLPNCVSCFGEVQAEEDAREVRLQCNAFSKLLRQWEGENK
jgi:hypothetical protein